MFTSRDLEVLSLGILIPKLFLIFKLKGRISPIWYVVG